MTDSVDSHAVAQRERRPKAPRQGAPAFRWSWKLVTIGGVDVYVHGTFLLLIAFLAYGELAAGRAFTLALRSVFLVLVVFTTVALHELGHALMARRLGVRTHDVTLLPIGGIARFEKPPDGPRQQLLVAFAGPAANLAVALALFVLLALGNAHGGIERFRYTDGPFLAQLMWLNVALAVFNLSPGFPMDGGRILRALLVERMPLERATQTAARAGQGVAVLLGAAGLLVSPLLLLIAACVWLGARAQYSLSTLRVALADLSVGQGMLTDFESVAPTDPLSRAVELTLAGFQRDFPVMNDRSSLVGVLTQSDLLSGLSRHGGALMVQQAMGTQTETAHPSEALDGALTRIHQSGCRVLMVVDDEKVVGVLTAGSIGERIAGAASG